MFFSAVSKATLFAGLRAVGGVAGDVGEKIGKVTEKPLGQVRDRVQAEKDKVMETVISKRMELSSAAKERGQRAKEAIRNAPKIAKAKLEKDKQERKKRQRDKLQVKMEVTSPMNSRSKKKKMKKKYEDEDSDSDKDGGGGEDDDDYGTPEFGSVAELRRLREQRLAGVENGGSKACNVM